jgi:hypothetical protein
MSNNKVFGTNINVSKLLNSYINRINNLVNKYHIDLCFNYDNIEYNLIENSIYNNLLKLIDRLKDIFDYNLPCLNNNENNISNIDFLLCNIEKHIKNTLQIDQIYIDNLISENKGKRYIPIFINTNTYIIENINIPSNMYFVIDKDNIIFNGQYNDIKVYNFYINTNKIQEFKGLIKNGSVNSSGLNNCLITNLFIDGKTNGSILHHSAGWITHKFFGNGVESILTNCYSNGDLIEDFTGGICGSNNAHNGNITINKCYSSGNIYGKYSGGITGNNFGENNGYVIITNCYSLGDIGIKNNIKNGQGGICGGHCGYINSEIIIKNCYAIGDINSDNSGGIVGQYSGFKSLINIVNCYSSGLLNGINVNGIVGSNSEISGNINIIDCYSSDNNNINDIIGSIGKLNINNWLIVNKSYPILKNFRINQWDNKYYNKYNDRSKFK